MTSAAATGRPARHRLRGPRRRESNRSSSRRARIRTARQSSARARGAGVRSHQPAESSPRLVVQGRDLPQGIHPHPSGQRSSEGQRSRARRGGSGSVSPGHRHGRQRTTGDAHTRTSVIRPHFNHSNSIALGVRATARRSRCADELADRTHARTASGAGGTITHDGQLGIRQTQRRAAVAYLLDLVGRAIAVSPSCTQSARVDTAADIERAVRYRRYGRARQHSPLNLTR